MGLSSYANAIRSHANTNVASAITASGTWGTVTQLWENLDSESLRPTPDPKDWENTSYIAWTLDPNINPWVSPGYVHPEGFLIAQCFTPENIGPEPCEALAELVAGEFRGSKRTFSSGAGVFRPAEPKAVGPEGGFYQINVRIEWWFREAA